MRRFGRHRSAWIVAAAAGGAVAVAVVAGSIGRRPPPASEDGAAGEAAVARETIARAVTPVTGSPGWDALSAADRRRARTPLSADARAWLRRERLLVRRIAERFEVSPVALGGLVAAEKTLLVGRVDVVGEELFRAVFGTLRREDLERWVADQERAFQRRTTVPAAGDWRAMRPPYLWTLGPAQVSFRLAIQNEPLVARRLDRPRRDAHEVLEAVLSTPGNMEYAAALLAEAERAYRDLARMDIADNPGVLATLYHVGAPTVRARRLAADNAARRARNEAAHLPQVNYYGAFVNLHADEIRGLLDLP